ncbi:MAG: DEAD/DEAH box helicase family protein [Candidatus Methanofastidiosia archaeon]|jgi:superfamily II DNA or RNA helicase
MHLHYYKGTIHIEGEYHIPHTTWDERSHNYRAQALYYPDIIQYLNTSQIEYIDDVLYLVPCPEIKFNINLREYQKEALSRWLKSKKGVAVLPTGSGKTMIALKAMEKTDCATLIVVPTLDLVDQWRETILKCAESPIETGEYTGRKKDLKGITVTTYDSAYIHADYLGNRFKLIIFDEVHHLPSEGYRHIAEMCASPYRLGLTATYKREDGFEYILPRLVGGKIYEIHPDELAGNHLSEYETRKIKVDMLPEETEKYEQNIEIFKNYLRSTHIRMQSPQDYQKIVYRSGYDPRAWRAVRARNHARKIAYNSQSKIEELKMLLKRHKNDRIIIFTRYNDLVYKIAKKFFIPCITYKTDKDERIDILKKFKSGIYTSIVSSQVLDEGIDVPEANIGIILSGTGSVREYTQRLGRVLRPTDKRAILYEIVSKDTAEIRTSARRSKG